MKKVIDSKLDNFAKSLKSSFATVKEEFEDHLQAINENTDELNAQVNLISMLESKIDKLNEKYEAILLNFEKMQKKNIEISILEQRIFLVFYTAADNLPFTIGDLARKTNLNELMIRKAITSMKEKGIMLSERVIEGLTYFYLDFEFKQKQIKENLISLDDNLLRTVNETSLTKFF